LSCAEATEGVDAERSVCAAVMASKYATGTFPATAGAARPHSSLGMDKLI
jgi:hypothetical protein